MLTFLLMLISDGQLNSIMLKIFASWSHIIKSGLLCGTFVAVFTDTFHQYSREFSLYLYSGSDESVIFLDG